MNKYSIASVLLVGTILITGIATAFAAKSDDLQSAPKISIPERMNPEQMHARVKSALDGLVKEGTINQSQEDAVLKEMAAKRKKFEQKVKADVKVNPCKDGKRMHHGRKHGVLKDLVKAGTITRDQADAIRKAIKSARDSEKKSE